MTKEGFSEPSFFFETKIRKFVVKCYNHEKEERATKEKY